MPVLKHNFPGYSVADFNFAWWKRIIYKYNDVYIGLACSTFDVNLGYVHNFILKLYISNTVLGIHSSSTRRRTILVGIPKRGHRERVNIRCKVNTRVNRPWCKLDQCITSTLFIAIAHYLPSLIGEWLGRRPMRWRAEVDIGTVLGCVPGYCAARSTRTNTGYLKLDGEVIRDGVGWISWYSGYGTSEIRKQVAVIVGYVLLCEQVSLILFVLDCFQIPLTEVQGCGTLSRCIWAWARAIQCSSTINQMTGRAGLHELATIVNC